MSTRGGVCFSFIRLFWVLFVCLDSLVRAQVSVIVPAAPVKASVGDEVILPCSLSPAVSAEALTVEWSRTEFRPHPSDRRKSVPYVYIYRDRREDTDVKIPEFMGRTELFPDQLRVGNVSLRISNISLTDNGTYRCHIPNLKSTSRQALVSLVVDPETVSPTESPVVPRQQDTDPAVEPQERGHLLMTCLILVFVAVVIGLLCIMRKRRHGQKTPGQQQTPVPSEFCDLSDTGAAGDARSLSMVLIELKSPTYCDLLKEDDKSSVICSAG